MEPHAMCEGGSAPLALRVARTLTKIRSNDIPPLAIEHAKMIVASTVASAAAGYGLPSTKIITEEECHGGGRPEATVWFRPERLPARNAARCNAVASDAAASDDSDIRSIAHIGTIICASSIAVGEAMGSSGEEVLRAMVLGYEFAGRMEEVLAPGRMRRGFHGSVATVFGGTVAAGILLGLDEERLAHAIALAATSIGGIAIAADTSWSREYHAGMSASSAVSAARAASAGYKAEPAVLEGPRGFVSAVGGTLSKGFCDDLGVSWNIISHLAIKLMPGGHHYHAIAEAAAAAAKQRRIGLQEITQIRVAAAAFTGTHGAARPTDLVSAAHSLSYYAAAAIADGGFRWEHIIDPQKVADPVILGLIDKVVYDEHPEASTAKPVLLKGGSVTIMLSDGNRLHHTCDAPRGSGPRGIEWADIDDKFDALVPLSGLGHEDIHRCLHMIHELENIQDIRQFVGLLNTPSRCPAYE